MSTGSAFRERTPRPERGGSHSDGSGYRVATQEPWKGSCAVTSAEVVSGKPSQSGAGLSPQKRQLMDKGGVSFG